MSPTRVRGTSAWRWLIAPIGSGPLLLSETDGTPVRYEPDAAGRILADPDHVAQLVEMGCTLVPEGDSAA